MSWSIANGSMTYANLIQTLFSKRIRLVPKASEQLYSVLESLGNPHLHYKTIHIAGTNGKGSVTTKIAKSLEYAGYKVGLFTSPHIENFIERIQVNGVEITEGDVERILPSLLEKFPGLCFFDYATFLAFIYFSEQKVDYAVIETGIGGLHDTTNVVHPIVSVITSVSYDHQEILGPTLDDIAYQKAGIIKPNIPIVIGPKARYKPIYDLAKLFKSRLIEVPPQEGSFDQENQAIARAALETMGQTPSEQGLLARPPCRFERRGRFLLDVAHNPEGIENLLKTWDYHYPGKKFVTIVGFSADKDLDRCLHMLGLRAEHLFLVSADTKRAATLPQLIEILERDKMSHFTPCASFEQAIELALASDHDILVCGSFYIMKQILRQIGRDNLSLSKR